jgi:two-component system response regulator HydG
MLQLIKVVTKVAKTDANILITGENGTGKEMLAKEIHRLSPRNSRQMLGIDMGAISESLFESELFGHERGAFTDAYESRPGKFEAANGSSLFMDEIGNLSIALQAKLLTVLQNRNVTRIGSNKVIPVDIRLISATNKDIPEMVKQGLFREDLFYRINTIHLEIPPLRERGDDILLFIDTFLRRFTSKYQRPDIRMHEQTIEKLRSYHWPGNIRELQHAIEKAVILCEGNVIRPKDILVKQSWKPQTASVVPNLEEVERQAIETAILQNNGNLTAAAEQLGISRQTLYNKLKRFKP